MNINLTSFKFKSSGSWINGIVHNKGTKHLTNVYNSQIIMDKEGIRISRKHFKALETKEQWLSDSVSLYETLMITK